MSCGRNLYKSAVEASGGRTVHDRAATINRAVFSELPQRRAVDRRKGTLIQGLPVDNSGDIHKLLFQIDL